MLALAAVAVVLAGGLFLATRGPGGSGTAAWPASPSPTTSSEPTNAASPPTDASRFNADGTMQECKFVSNAELSEVVAGRPTGMPLGGIVDATLGQVLDKRLLADARDCWLVDESNTAGGYTGRMALQEGGSFEAELGTAQEGGFYATDISGFGDQAFCTAMAETGSTGALVRQGGNLAYVSLIAGDGGGFDFSEAPNGVLYSPATCEQAAAIAVRILR